MADLLNPLTLIPSATDPLSISSFLDSPEMRRQRMWDTLGGIGMAMLQASGPSPYQRGFGDVLAAGLAGGAQAGIGSEDRYLKRAMVGAQVAKARSQIESDNKLNAMFTNPGAGSPGAGPAPTVTLPPTTAPHAAPPGQQAVSPEGVNPNNIGNVRPVGSSTGFQQPATLEDGVRLAVSNVKAYPGAFNNGQPMNLFQIGERWAPKGDGANDPRQWAMNVAQIGGLDPNAPLDFNNPQVAAAFARGVHGAEHGQKAIRPAEYYAGVLTGQTIPQGSDSPVPGVPNGSGQPVQPVQYSPPAVRPQTLQDVINSMPPGVRQLATALDRQGKMNLIMKYADPGSEAVLDTQTNQVVFVPKTIIGRDPRFQPIEGAKLEIQRGQLANSQRQTDINERNATVVQTPGGPMLNPTLEQKADAETERKMLEGDYADVRKANSAAQEGALQARTGLANISRLSSLLDQVQTGRLTSTTQEIKAMAKGLGVDLTALGVADNVGPGEAARALSNQIALTLRNPAGGAGMPGALSDQDRQFLQQMIPSLETTSEGRKLMVEYMKRVYQRQIDVAKISNDFMRSSAAKKDPGQLYTRIQEFADANPLFDPQRDVPTGGMSPMPAPPAGYSVQGGAAPAAPAIPAPPSGFRVIP